MTSADSATRASDLLRALAHPLRMQIVEQLSLHEHRCVHELVDELGSPQPTVSQHLQVLRTARLVVGNRAGKEVRYSLTDNHVAHIVLDALAHADEVEAAAATQDQRDVSRDCGAASGAATTRPG